MSEAEKRKHRVCFTGHRPEKLRRSEQEVSRDLEQQIRQAIDDGFSVFISGMARGVDIWAAEIVLRIRQGNPSIRLICASPYQGFESKWSVAWQKRYQDVMDRADLIRFISSGYSPSCFQRRNEWMVDHAARVIAVYNREPGGTRNTIEYCKRLGLELTCIEG